MRPSDSNHQTIASWIRTYLSDTFTNPMVQTVVLEKLGTKMLTLYETDPVGGPEQGAYLNLVVELATSLSPDQLLGICHRIETASDRVRDVRWGARTLDIDILWMQGIQQDNPRLTIPHPRWQERRFVLAPLRDLAPDLVTETELNLAEGTIIQVEPLFER